MVPWIVQAYMRRPVTCYRFNLCTKTLLSLKYTTYFFLQISERQQQNLISICCFIQIYLQIFAHPNMKMPTMMTPLTTTAQTSHYLDFFH